MAEKFVVKTPEHFTNQAQKHRQMAEHTLQMLSSYQKHHDNLVATTTNSCLGDAIQPYLDWWENFKAHLQSHADLHSQMANHLDKSINNYIDTDINVSHGFEQKN